MPSITKADLERLAAARIYFAHQSVGNNIIEGLGELAAAENVPLRIVEHRAASDDLPGIVHNKVGRNREPQTKCDAFSEFLTQSVGHRWDVAVLKFCYADLGSNAERDPARLIEAYQRTVAAIRAARPDVLLVHATVPLLSEGRGRKNAVRKLLGLGTSNDEGNVIRNRYNDLLRTAFDGEPLFDVARAESTRSDGTRTGFRKGGQFIFSMAPEFTYDEGHLSPAGRRWVAQEFASTLAAALRQRS